MRTQFLSSREARKGYLLVMPLIMGYLVFYAVPFILVLRNSVYKGICYSEEFIGLGNYLAMLNNGVFRLAFINTIKYLLVSLSMIIVVSYAIAIVLKTTVRKHEALKSVLLLPYIMPVVGTVMMMQLLFSEMGLLNQVLYTLELPVKDWLNSNYAFGVVVLLYLWKNTGYCVILLLAGLNTIPEEHYAVSELDGATFFQQLLYITFPQMWYSVFIAVVFSLINAFSCFREILIIGGVRPHESIYMLQHFINNAFEKMNYPKLSVAAVLLLMFLVVPFVIGYHWVMKKEEYKE